MSVPVKFFGQNGRIAGTLCQPPGAKAVQLLQSGFTYDRTYWDFPYKPNKYSYVQAANREGYATLAIDRLGSGDSSHPLSIFNTAYADAATVHQVISALKNGKLPHRYEHVASVGHSEGGLVAAVEAGIYKDVDALATTAIAHGFNYANATTKLIAPSYPATLDPKFSRQPLDALYATTMPGTRNKFYAGDPSATDPNVVRVDERTKSMSNIVKYASEAGWNYMNVDRTLNIPVFAAIGQQDAFLCGLASLSCNSSRDVFEHERPYYGPEANVTGYLASNTGHNMQLEKSSPETTGRIQKFISARVPGRGEPDTAPGSAPSQTPAPNPKPTSASIAANNVAQKAAVPLIKKLQDASDVVPGLGTNQNPIPQTAALFPAIGNTVDRLLGSLPERILGAHK